jgi:cell division septation protein DedD
MLTMLLRFSIFTLLLLLPTQGAAQSRGATARGGTAARQSPDSAIARALALNNEQRGAEARAVVDSLLRSLQPNVPAYADALFWKAMLADSEQVAEDQYNRIVREYPLHRRAEESLIRLAQLEMTRGNRSMAQRHLDRLIIEHPYGQFRSRASYWRARLFLEENELERACAELGMARARLPADDVELRSEIDFAARRCANVPAPSVANRGAKPPSGPPSVPPATKTPPQASQPPTTQPPTTQPPPTAGRGRSATPAAFSVQAAAFPARQSAESFVETLRGRGYEARVVEAAPMFRVWVGRFPTRAGATALATELRTRQIASGAFVVEAGGR